MYYILRARRGSLITTLGPRYLQYSYMEPLGNGCVGFETGVGTQEPEIRSCRGSTGASVHFCHWVSCLGSGRSHNIRPHEDIIPIVENQMEKDMGMKCKLQCSILKVSEIKNATSEEGYCGLRECLSSHRRLGFRVRFLQLV